MLCIVYDAHCIQLLIAEKVFNGNAGGFDASRWASLSGTNCPVLKTGSGLSFQATISIYFW